MSANLQEEFATRGYTVLPRALDAGLCHSVRDFVLKALDPLLGPAEYEAETGYPGAPENLAAQGGQTPRRLLHAWSRSNLFAQLAQAPVVVQALQSLLSAPVVMSQCHHNCVMTKHPGYSSATLWHQDIRYWSFDRPELISAWFALGHEHRTNGALRVIPSSHQLDLDRGALDRDLFLRPDLSENKQLIRQAVDVEMQAGDVLLFHCRLFHAAGTNRSEKVKISPVFTYHAQDNQPIPGTRSAAYPGVPMASENV